MKKEKSYRNVYLWGSGQLDDPHIQKHVSYFEELIPGGPIPPLADQPVSLKQKSKLSARELDKLKAICGEQEVNTDDFSRLKNSYGKFYAELLELRFGKGLIATDAVVFPKSEEELSSIIEFANNQKISIVPFGAGSSVTRGTNAIGKCITINLSKNYNKIINIDEVNMTVTAQAGILGPQLEKALNEKGFTCGHFPQSFEFSTLGGWVSARGAGQTSTGHGKIEQIMISAKLFTPAGEIHTMDFPAVSMGPDLNQIICGSEGSLGVISEVTIKIRRHRPQHSKLMSFLFKDFESAVDAMREIMQAQAGHPHMFRISDGDETEVAFQMKKISGSFADKFLNFLGYKPKQRSLLYATIEGDPDFNKFLSSKIKLACKKHGAFYLRAYATKKWLEQRYSSAYMRDPLMDKGIRLDTLETAVNWRNLSQCWSEVRKYVKSFPNAICLTHISHAYENGCNLYFVFGMPMAEKDEIGSFAEFHKGLIETIFSNGGSLSHHHGIGRMLAPFLEQAIGSTGFHTLQSIKDKLDPNRIMNPGALNLE